MRKTRMVSKVVSVLGALTLLTALPAATASAATVVPNTVVPNTYVSDGHVLSVALTGGCLDDSAAFGTRVIGCNGLQYQDWQETVWDDGTFQLKNDNTNRCIEDLNVPDGNGGHVLYVTTSCNSSQQQSWYAYGQYQYKGQEIVNQYTGYCLDFSTSYDLRTFPCGSYWSPSPYQTWYGW